MAHWRVLLSVLLGVLLASTIISGTVVYFDALRDLALNRSLAKHGDQELDILITGDRGPTTREEHRLLFNLVDRYVAPALATSCRALSTRARRPPCS